MDNIILTLLCLPKVGKKTVSYLIENMIDIPKDEKELLELFIECKINYKRISLPTSDDLKIAKEKSQIIIENSIKQNIKYIDILSKKFPQRLININNSPVALFYKGNYDSLNELNSVAIIGSRKAGQEGLEAAYKLGYDFGKENYSVISGLAIGCDEQVHRGCVKAKGKSIAVLPCGLDDLYPSSNNDLAQEILENNGCLISEYCIGTKAFRNNFIERDRIQSGLSSCVIVCESEINSGTMHTFNFAKQQNKIIACVDIDISGNKKIIEEEICIIINDKFDYEKIKNQILKFNESNKTKIRNLNTKQLKINY
ncbi:MAG: DNA-processing protein DprA [Romboutsia sp.]|uniref:DNA-processing protein DprA n=1 Tax=Romboutsia sp. TaxID=1965302 RepID=UPI003F2E030E